MKILEPNQYSALLPLLPNDTAVFYPRAILSQKYEGRVVADDEVTPTAAVVIKGGWIHLLGEPSNADFVAALRQGLTDGTVMGYDAKVLYFVEPSAAWRTALAGFVPDREFIPSPRSLFIGSERHFVGKRPFPPNYTLHAIDENLPAPNEGELPSDVQKVLRLREGAGNPDEMAYGFVAVQNGRFASWAVVDFIVGEEGEIRVFTDDAHRKQGLAFALSTAAIAYGLSRHLTQLRWDVAQTNANSVRLAKRLGLRLERTISEQLLVFPEVGYWVNLAFWHLDRDDFGETAVVAQQMTQRENKSVQQYGAFLLGAAYAGQGQHDKAIAQLQHAIATGFNNLWELQNCAPLTALHNRPEWEQLIASLAAS